MNTVRRAERGDIPGIDNLLAQVLLVHHKGRPDIFKEKGQKYTEEELVGLIENEEDPIFVCVNEHQRVIGHCFCKSVDRPERPSSYPYKTLYIDDLCVDEEMRGQHIGATLYEHVKQYAKENGYYNITLHAWECNPAAVGFYKHLGLDVQQYVMEEII